MEALSLRRKVRKGRQTLLILVIPVILLFWAGVSYTGSDSYCAACHSMTPFIRSHTFDRAHAKIRCIDCHVSPVWWKGIGDRFRFTVMDAFATLKSREHMDFHTRIPDGACLRGGCHRYDELDEKADLRSIPAYRSFRHIPHVDSGLPRGLSLSCASCHIGETKGGKVPHFHVSIQNCLPCHLPPEGSAFEAFFPVEDGRCLECHTASHLSRRIGHGSAKRQWRLLFSKGVGKTIKCMDCHPLYGKSPLGYDAEACSKCHGKVDIDGTENDSSKLHHLHVVDKRADCVDCHTLGFSHGKGLIPVNIQMDCDQCHENDKERFVIPFRFYAGRYYGFSGPDPMAEAGVACQACHVRGNRGCSNGRSCDRCHDEAYLKLVDRWQETIRNKSNDLKNLLNTAIRDGKIAEIPLPMRLFLENIEKDGSFGVHNVHDINKLLNTSIEKMRVLIKGENK